ncbi:MAG: hypothetical protein JST55_09660 [Bacteroidetes bacterium]|nr:hypothetical protein [Bacteroidota bacterium]
MLTTQTAEILRSLDKTELKRFGDFIKSPYFNTTKPLEKIFDIVQKTFPEFEGESLSRERIYKKLYPSETYNEKRIKNLSAEFSNLLKKFLAHEYLAKNKLQMDVNITTELTKKNLNKISEKLIAKSLIDNDDGLLSIADRFHYVYPLNVNHAHNLGNLREHGSPEYLQSDIELIEKLIIFFMTNIYQLSFYDTMNHKIFMMDENPILKVVAGSIDAEKILSYMGKTGHEYTSYLRVHYLFHYYSQNDVTEEKYLEFKKEILSTIRKVKKLDQTQFIFRMIHMIISKLSVDTRKYYEDVIEFAELIDELEIFTLADVKTFDNGPFRDIFIIAIALKKYDWAENFVNKYINFMNKDLRHDTENFCRGVLAFKRGKFEDSLRHFSVVKMIDIVEKLNIRFYYMMNYIELKSYESALSALQSFRQFTHDSDVIPEMFATRVQDSLKYFAEIIKCEEKGERIEEWMIKEVEEKKGIIHKQYLLEKMEKLI